ncbi:putative anthocyanin 6''-O-malonyltransferase [Helianthus annuus]|nr:putative anthocyanin 6''-O-malonyltransferase [Helianthus annuus]
MASSQILTILEESQVSPPTATIGDRLLPLTFFDFLWLREPPLHILFFYELSITQIQFTEIIIPNLKHSLSITLQHFFPFAGNLIVYPTFTQKPEIRYVEGDFAWTSITRCGTDASFLANGALPLYDRVVINPKFDESYLKLAKVENFKEEYQPQKLCGPTNKVRATFILPWTVLNKLKTLVSTQVPTLAYVSSFTVACAYVWSCMAKTRKDELQLFRFVIDCRARMNLPIPLAYFGNCVIGGCKAMENTTLLTGKEGFVNAAKLIGESLHKAARGAFGEFNRGTLLPIGVAPPTLREPKSVRVKGVQSPNKRERDGGPHGCNNQSTFCLFFFFFLIKKQLP